VHGGPKSGPRPPAETPRAAQNHPQRPRKRPKTSYRGPSTSHRTMNRYRRTKMQRKEHRYILHVYERVMVVHIYIYICTHLPLGDWYRFVLGVFNVFRRFLVYHRRLSNRTSIGKTWKYIENLRVALEKPGTNLYCSPSRFDRCVHIYCAVLGELLFIVTLRAVGQFTHSAAAVFSSLRSSPHQSLPECQTA